jgi:hypothetical protein
VIDHLKGEIEKQAKITEDLSVKVEEEKKINKVEDEKFRKLA